MRDIRWFISQVILVILVAGPCSGELRAPQVYWTDNDNGTLHRANLDGSGKELLFQAPDNVEGLAIDVPANKMYWVENAAARIGRANLDGTGVEYVVSGVGGIANVTLDVLGGKMYWAGSGVWRSNLDGTDQEMILAKTTAFAGDVELDLVHGKLYWVRIGGASSGKIGRANLDGTDLEVLWQGGAYTLTLDVPAQRMYVADWFDQRIHSLNFDGSGHETLFTTADGLRGPRDLCLFEGMLYWTQDHESNYIKRANLETMEIETVLDLGPLVGPTGIQVVPEPATLSLLALGGLLALRRRR